MPKFARALYLKIDITDPHVLLLQNNTKYISTQTELMFFFKYWYNVFRKLCISNQFK